MTRLKKSNPKACKIDGKKWAVYGSDFCTVHGGNLPRAREKAAAAIENARRMILEQPDAPLHVNSAT